MTNDEIIAVVQAHKDGKTIQYCNNSAIRPSGWQDATAPIWNFDDYSYRIKSEPRPPREFWVRKCPNALDRRLEVFEFAVGIGCDKCEFIHVREVKDESK